MSALAVATPAGPIAIGYRSPQLSDELDAAGKMALAHELGMSVIEPQCNKREITDLDSAKELGQAARDAGIGIPSLWL